MSELTPRELEVIELVAQARANKEIASELAISPQTVKNHLQNIFGKLGIENRVGLAVYWIANAREQEKN